MKPSHKWAYFIQQRELRFQFYAPLVVLSNQKGLTQKLKLSVWLNKNYCLKIARNELKYIILVVRLNKPSQ